MSNVKGKTGLSPIGVCQPRKICFSLFGVFQEGKMTLV
jgi:hypothetical protein